MKWVKIKYSPMMLREYGVEIWPARRHVTVAFYFGKRYLSIRIGKK